LVGYQPWLNIGSAQWLRFESARTSIDKITKEDLLRLVGQVLEEDSADLDEFDVDSIKNQAHQVIYKSVSQKLNDLRKRRTEFLDESARLFLDEYERYRE
jgi:hypothetical protein